MTFNNDRHYDFKVDLTYGQQAEHLLYDALHNKKVEVKWDQRSTTTGNLYVEYQHDPGATGAFVDSGILTTKADWYAFKVGDAFVLLPVSAVRQLAKQAWADPTRRASQPNGSCPTRGVLLRLSDLLETNAARPLSLGEHDES